MFRCEPADLTFVRTVSLRFSSSVASAVAPEQLFDVHGDAAARRASVVAFTADYRVEAEPDGCQPRGIVAQKPAGPTRQAMLAVAPLLNLSLRRVPSNLRRYADVRAARPS